MNAPAPNAPHQPAALTPKLRWALGLILVASLIFHGAYLGEVADTPDYLRPGVDAGFHDYWAQALITGDWTPPPGSADPHTADVPFVRPPGYPYFLAAVYRLFGVHPLPIRIVQMAVSLASCLLAFGIGRRAFGAVVGLLWAGGFALYWAFCYFDMELHATTLEVFTLLAATYLLVRWLERGTLGFAAAAGAVWGISALLRPTALTLLPLIAVWMVCTCHRRGQLRRGWPAVVVFIAVGLLAVAPATVRNWRVSGDLVLISANGGVNLYIGNNPMAEGHATGQVFGYDWFHTPYDYPALVRSVERKVGHAISYAGASRHFAREALRYAAGHPARTLKLLAVKTLLYWGPVEIPNNKELNMERSLSPTLSLMPLTFARVLPLALAGMVAAVVRLRRARQDEPTNPLTAPVIWLTLLTIAGLFLTVLPFFVAGRYRVPTAAFLLLFAAIAVQAFVELVMRRRFARAVVSAIAVGAVFLICRTQWTGPGPDRARWHFDRAAAWGRVGKPENALPHYLSALELRPDFALARISAALILRDDQRFDDAIGLLAPIADSPGPYQAKALLFIGKSLANLRRFDEAVAHLEAARAIDPDLLEISRELAWILNAAGRHLDALAEIERLMQADPDDASARLFYGLTLRALGRNEEAQPYIDAALRQKPELRAALQSE